MKIQLIPLLKKNELHSLIHYELLEHDLHSRWNDVIDINWEEEKFLPIFKSWLIEKFGKEVEQYNSFAIKI